MACIALTQLAWEGAAPDERVVGYRDGQAVTRGAFIAQVHAWCAAFREVRGPVVALYFADALDAAAALYGAWHAGKAVVLPGDMQPATLGPLLAGVDACAGQLPGALQPLPQAGRQDLQTLSLRATRLTLFTSGSSGQPARIEKCLGQLDAEVQALQALFAESLDADGMPCVLATVSHQHIYGLLFRLLWPLAAGRPTEALPLSYPEELVHRLLAWPGCLLVSSPAFLARLPVQLDWAQASPGLRAVFSSGGPLPADASAQALALLAHSPTEVFGSSETGGIAWRRRAEHGEQWALLPGVDCRVNAQGLLEVRSPHLPDADQWWETADRAQAHADGQGFGLLGRADRIVKIAEKRVSLTAIEQALLASAWVREARAVVLESAASARIGMVVVLSEAGWLHLQAQGRRAMQLALRALVAPHVERVALPRHWRYVEHLPLNAQGKSTQQQLALLFRPVMPALEWLQRDAQQARARWQVAADLLVFDGHFPDAPLVPGVSQLHWVEWTARQAFALAPNFLRADVLKFQLPILPGAAVDVALEWHADRAALHFSLTSGQGTHASGRLFWGA
ncbi:acyl-CoA synthetase [Acidovorax sp. Be4]|uniref:Acyl-CoA synthetase n=1 Tax=Acidovorax bellezanensis TaxID=2976702 RepID=A0ABT2PR48_9BURK|nr:AMP-binding protein [Acidovorax sp. Be4]MCT9812951.1 acyl-CoA synthetase [Acidovorax sp. Be4]